MVNLHFRRTRQRLSKADLPGTKVDQEQSDDDDDDAQWYKQEVGVEPDPGNVCNKLSPTVCVCVFCPDLLLGSKQRHHRKRTLHGSSSVGLRQASKKPKLMFDSRRTRKTGGKERKGGVKKVSAGIVYRRKSSH